MTIRASEPIFEAEPLPASLVVFVRSFVTRSRWLSVIRAVGIAVAFCLIWTLAWAVFDRLLPMPGWLRGILLLIQASAAVAALVRPVSRLMDRRVPWQRAAAAIEANNPSFGGGLQTALSQLQMPADQRGSASMLEQVVSDTAAKATHIDPISLLPASPAIRPMAIAAVAGITMIILTLLPWLNLPRLLKRELFPFLNAAPVTTTRLSITPGSVDVIQGDALTINVQAERLGDSQPLLQWRGEDPVFSSAVMPPEPSGFAYKFSSIDRPIVYRVVGGDATSPLFNVHVSPRPGVRRMSVSFTYPDWTELPPTKMVPTNGDLEGPVGTIATISVRCSEAISNATAVIGETKIESAKSVDPAVRLMSLPMLTTGPWRIDLVSQNGITGSGPSGLSIHANPMQRPQAMLRLPAEEDELRLHPRDVLSLGYQASDQFALAGISAEVAVNSVAPTSIAIPVGANHKMQAGSFDLDLAQLGVNLGDIVTITLIAQNKAGLRGTSLPCRVVISPRSIDLNAEQRLTELRRAAQLAKLLGDEVTVASKALDQSPPGDDKEARDEQVAPHLALADGATAELGQELLRALAHSNGPELSTALVWAVDANQQSASELEATDAAVLTEMRDPLRDRLNHLTGMTNTLQQALDAFWRGEAAARLLADAEDAKADEAHAPSLAGAQADAVRRSAQRAHADEATGCKDLGIDPQAGDLESQLKTLVERSVDMVKRFGPVDFSSAAAEWSAAGADAQKGLVARLTIGSQAEAVRPGGDFIWARDLGLSARAARRIDTANDEPPDARKDYPAALRALQQTYLFRLARTPADQQSDASKSADEARRRMRLWAGELESASRPAASTQPTDPERAALETAAAEAEQKIEQESRLEQPATAVADPSSSLELPPTPNSSAQPLASPAEMAKLKQAAAASRRLERLSAQQRMLRLQTTTTPDSNLAELSKEQAALTDAIAAARTEQTRNDLQPDQPADHSQEDAAKEASQETTKDSRESAMNAIRSAQERLAEMPREIERSRQAAEQKREAERIAEQARQDADSADQDAKSAAGKTADETRAAADSAKAQASAAQVSPDDAANVSASLRAFAPEATPAVDAIDQQLTPALTSMRQSQSAGDEEGTQRSARQATAAVAEVQRRLSEGLQGLLKRDALTTAKFFSGKAAEALAKAQPDRAGAMKLQRGASAALEQAWDDALHQSAGQRLARMPSMASILRLYPGESTAASEGAMGVEPAPAEREWGRLREQRPDHLSASSHEIDPPEYQDALRAYFKDLATQDRGPK